MYVFILSFNIKSLIKSKFLLSWTTLLYSEIFNSLFLVYYNFSEGEKKKIDLSVMFTFLDFLNFKNKYSESNLLILDEVSSGLDTEGRLMLFEILQAKSKKTNIILIDHTDNSDFVDRNFRVSVKNKFSFIEE